jgi:hypothetical protein
MRQKNARAINKIAKTLPELMMKRKVFRRVSGTELLKTQLYINGEPIRADFLYTLKETVAVPANHVERLKAEYALHGEDGLTAYITTTKREARKQQRDKANKAAGKKTAWQQFVILIKSILNSISFKKQLQ